MPLPKGLARFNRKVTNRLMMPLAERLGGFAVLEHTGRQSGKTHLTPLNVFQDDEAFLVALTYGPDVDWLKNARASKTSTLITHGKRVTVAPPEAIGRAEGYQRLPSVVRVALAALDVSEFVVFPVLQSDQRINTLPDSDD